MSRVEWETSARERMLEALAAVCAGVKGVQHVSRQAITGDALAERQLPAVLIDELQTRYDWRERHGRRHAELVAIVALNLQVPTQRLKGRAETNASTMRELFVHAVLGALIENPTLVVQLDGEPEPCEHARDVVGELADVRYFAGNNASSQALVTLEVIVEERFDARSHTAWTELVTSLGQPQADESPNDGLVEDHHDAHHTL